jgi:hypothetical protein
MFTTIPPASFVMAFLGFLPRTGGGDLGILRGALQWPLLLYDLGSSLAGRLPGVTKTEPIKGAFWGTFLGSQVERFLLDLNKK